VRFVRSDVKEEEVEGMVVLGMMRSLEIVARRPRSEVDVRRDWRAVWSSADAGGC
jgi:hypothetical protein